MPMHSTLTDTRRATLGRACRDKPRTDRLEGLIRAVIAQRGFAEKVVARLAAANQQDRQNQP